MNKDLQYKIAITLLPFAGPVNTKKLIDLCGSPEAVFQESATVLFRQRVPERIVKAIKSSEIFTLAEQEMVFMQKNTISACYYQDPDYPERLRECEDGPVLIYTKGQANLSPARCISIVGTRNATSYGLGFCEQLVADLAEHDVTIVSGMAYGIDICAHRTAVKHNLPTIGVLAHGLNRLYPGSHHETARQMMNNGALLTDFPSHAPFHPGNFPSRNRIVAGISDATIVIESATKGGSLITAEIAQSYHREVFAVPGRINDNHSRGCNVLVKKNKAALMESADDLLSYLQWEKKTGGHPVQTKLFEALTTTEQRLVQLLTGKKSLFIEEICMACRLDARHLASTLLDLELKGIVKTLPGNRYALL